MCFVSQAEKDDVGVSTVEEMGTRYSEEKVWTGLNPKILKCQRLIDLSLAKIVLTEGLGRSALDSQKALLTVMAAKWSAGLQPMLQYVLFMHLFFAFCNNIYTSSIRPKSIPRDINGLFNKSMITLLAMKQYMILYSKREKLRIVFMLNFFCLSFHYRFHWKFIYSNSNAIIFTLIDRSNPCAGFLG